MGIITFGNPQLLVGAQWYPPPQGAPADIRSFAREQAYICCIDKTHAVFRYRYAQNQEQLRSVRLTESDNLERAITTLGIDLLFKHNLPADAWGKIEINIVSDLYDIAQLPRDLVALIVQYYGCNMLLAEILYPLVIQTTLMQRKIHCAAGAINDARDRSWNNGPMFSAARRAPENVEDLYESSGKDFITHRKDLPEMQNLISVESVFLKTNFKTTIIHDRELFLMVPLQKNDLDPPLLNKTPKQLDLVTHSITHGGLYKTDNPYHRFSKYIRTNYQTVPPPSDTVIQPIIDEYKQPLEGIDRQIPPVVLPAERSCLEMIINFFQALWETLSNCFRAIIDCCR